MKTIIVSIVLIVLGMWFINDDPKTEKIPQHVYLVCDGC